MGDSKAEYILEKQLNEYEKLVRQFFKRWMENYWGKRCPEKEEGCCLCKAWECFDYLFEEFGDDE